MRDTGCWLIQQLHVLLSHQRANKRSRRPIFWVQDRFLSVTVVRALKWTGLLSSWLTNLPTPQLRGPTWTVKTAVKQSTSIRRVMFWQGVASLCGSAFWRLVRRCWRMKQVNPVVDLDLSNIKQDEKWERWKLKEFLWFRIQDSGFYSHDSYRTGRQ